MRVFTRTRHGVTFHDHPFTPFILLADQNLLDTSAVFTTRQQLAGSGALCWLVKLHTWHDWCQLRDHLLQENRPDAWFGIPDSCQQFLISSGISFFKEMAADQVTVLCLAITVSDSDRISAIAVADNNGYEEILSSVGMAEPEMLERLSRIIQARNPDVVSGYRLTGFDLPCIIKRANHYGLRLGWGRDGSEPHLQQGGDKHGQQRNYGVYGRSVIDTGALVRHYDRQVRPLPGTGLQEVAEWFGCAAQQDVRQIMALYQLLVPAWYQQAQLYPVSFQSAVSRPGAVAVNALLTQVYLHQQQALPAPVKTTHPLEQRSGELFQRGQAGPIVRCDLSELPVSIMLAYRITPCGDVLDVFLPLLSSIKQLCSQTQRVDTEAHDFPLQSVLLPAWYDLLAHTQLPFSDPDAAIEVKRLERVMQGDLLGWLREQGAKPIAFDQQGICFVPPNGHSGADEITVLMKRLTGVLPSSANLRCSGHYKSMFVYSQNNYALLEQNGTMVYRGNRFSSRSMEPFLLDFLKEALGLLLEGKAAEVRTLYARYLRRLSVHNCPLSWLMRTETLADTRENYQQAVQTGKRNRAAVYELALLMPEKWVVGDRISYYVAGNSKNVAVYDYCRFITDFDPTHPDLNIPWYTERLDQLFKRLEPFLPVEPMLF
jgi:DNA polymerase, archaea type